MDGVGTTAFKHEFLISWASAAEMDSGFNLDLQTLGRYRCLPLFLPRQKDIFGQLLAF